MESDGKHADENEKEKLEASSRTLSPALKHEHECRDAKAAKILEACEGKDIEALRTLATAEGGLVSDEVRRLACSYHHGMFLRPMTDRYRAASSWLCKPRCRWEGRN